MEMRYIIFVICVMLLTTLCSADQSCGSTYSEGDKWFDGCNWCVCDVQGQRCTNSTCEHLLHESDVSPCQKLGESWRDGCYHCRCLPNGIRCKVNKRCLNALRHMQSGCDNKDLCVCGLDGVPSCINKIMSRFSSKTLPSFISGHFNDRKLILPAKHNGELTLNADETENELNDEPPSLISAGDNPCELGPRWYGGGLRCYCHPKNGVRCGNPRFIARKVDGFKLRIKACVKGQIWEERCRICYCKRDGFSFCRIDRECLKNTNIRHSIQAITSCSGKSCRVATGGAQCKIGSRWREGCKRCRCTKRSKVICKSRLCNESDNDKTGNQDTQHGHKSTGVQLSKASFKPPAKPRFRMPDFFTNSRITFNRRKRPKKIKGNCNGFKTGEKYWEKCNLCHCTSRGAICSTKLC